MPIDVAAHRHQEEQDVGEGTHFDAEHEPRPEEAEASIRWVGQDGVEEAPPEIAHGDEQHEGASHRARPRAVPRPVQGEDKEEGRYEKRRPEAHEMLNHRPFTQFMTGSRAV